MLFQKNNKGVNDFNHIYFFVENLLAVRQVIVKTIIYDIDWIEVNLFTSYPLTSN